MKKLILVLLSALIFYTAPMYAAFTGPCPEGQQAGANGCISASTDPIISSNILGIADQDLRTGNVNMDSISQVIVNVINVLLGVAGTVAVVALIYYAVQMQLASGITGDSSKVDNAKKGMIGALIGFVIAILAWFIVIQFIKTLSQLS